MSRQKTEVNDLADNEKAPSFKISGLIILCVFGVLFFFSAPYANAGPMSPAEHIMKEALVTIIEIPETIGRAFFFVTDPLLNFFTTSMQ